MDAQNCYFDACAVDLADTIPMPMFVTDSAGKLVTVNDAFCSLVGAPRSTFSGEFCRDLGAFGALFQDVGDNHPLDVRGEAQVLHSSVTMHDGQRLEVDVHRTRFDNLPAEDTYWINAIVVVNDAKSVRSDYSEIKDALQARVKELRCLYDVSILLDLFDKQSGSVMQRVANRIPEGMMRASDVSAEIQIDERCFRSDNFVHSDLELIAKINAHGLQRGHVRITYAGDDYRTAEEAFLAEERVLLRHLARTIGQSLGAYESIKRVQAQKELFEHTFERAAIGICHASLSGEILRPNQRFCELLGYTVAEMKVLSLSELIHPDDMQLDMSVVRDTLMRGDALEAAEQRYFRKDEAIIWGRLEISLVRKENGAPDYFVCVLHDITERHHNMAEIRSLTSRVRQTFVATIGALSEAMEHRDPYTAGHQKQVASLSVAIGQRMGLSETQLEGLRIGATIHDIGKIYVPAEILGRPGKLSSVEFDLIKTHSQIGHEIIKGIDMPWPVAAMVYQHHERLDGTGYPNGLKHSDIILEARIIGVADTVDAVISHRPYRPGRPIDEAISILKQSRGIAFDAEVVDHCIAVLNTEPFQSLYAA